MADRSYDATFGPILADIEAEMFALRQQQRGIAALLWEIVDYQFGWDLAPEDAAQRAKVAGKKIRPLLMALIAQAIAGAYQHVLPAGAALEFLHNFTLIHDDVMDRSPERRHRPAVWTRWGSAQAINAGDGLYALANLTITRLLDRGNPAARVVRAFRVMSQACLWTAEGQILDMDYENRKTVTAAEYLVMVANKTGALIEAAAAIGALLSTDDEAVIEAFARFGRNLGIAFQVRDDYLGVWGDEAATGKSATSDIREKKKTYPVLVAFERAGDADRAALRRLYAQETLSDDDVQTVLAILARTQAAAFTDQIAGQYFDAALDDLDASGVQGATQDLIRQYARFLIRRAH